MEDKFEREVLDRLIIIETKMDMLSKTSGKVDDAYRIANKNQEDVAEIKDNIKWLWRTAIGAVITGAIGIFVAIIKVKVGL